MKFIQTIVLIIGLTFVFSASATAQRFAKKAKSKVENTPQAKVISKVMKIVVRETLESIGKNKNSLKNFPCASLHVNDSTETATIDFGEGCKGKGKHTHSGIIVLHYNNQEQNENKKVALELQDYKINNRLIEGINFLAIDAKKN